MPPAVFGLKEAIAALPARAHGAHKHQSRVLLIAGSSHYLGAALLCARGAYRGGAGYVRLALPASLGPFAMAALPEAVVEPLAADEGLDESHLATLLALATQAAAVVVGPGLGRAPGTQALVRGLWQGVQAPALFDADALSALDPGLKPGAARILTPHEGELKLLLGPQALAQGRPEAAQRLARDFGAVALLKGPGTELCAPDGRCATCGSGSAVLASAGTGDVLAGLIGALLAQGAGVFEAAALGAWLHGRAGERWAAGHAGRGLLATDLADGIPLALAEAGA